MQIKELNFIKAKQREFETLFGKKLFVDVPKTLGIKTQRKYTWISDEEMERVLNDLVCKYGADLDILRNKRIKRDYYPNEWHALNDFIGMVIQNRWSYTKASKVINKDRSNFYHYENQYQQV
jgi:hypothetical protein